MSLIKIGFAAIGSLIALTASAAAEVRYSGFPKLGYYVVSSAPAKPTAASKSSVYDARAELSKTEIPARQSPFSKGGINSRGI